MEDLKMLSSVQNADVNGKRVLLRVDFNVPFSEGLVNDITRIERAAPTIAHLIAQGATVLLISHFGRPKGRDASLSLALVAEAASKVLGIKITFVPGLTKELVDGVVDALPRGSVVLLENLRYYDGEMLNDPDFAQQLASLGEIYVNDAFSCSHRKHASIDYIKKLLPSYAGLSLQDELRHLNSVVNSHPVAAVIGGAKTTTKLPMLKNLASKADFLILGGGLSNTFLSARGFNVGNSVFEACANEIAAIYAAAEKSGCSIILPVDHVTSTDMDGSGVVKINTNVSDKDCIFDIGPDTSAAIEKALRTCRTVFWNGPMGVFEKQHFAQGTERLLAVLADLHRNDGTLTVIGGGDSIFAAKSFGYSEKDFSYVSTGGGALLDFLGRA